MQFNPPKRIGRNTVFSNKFASSNSILVKSEKISNANDKVNNDKIFKEEIKNMLLLNNNFSVIKGEFSEKSKEKNKRKIMLIPSEKFFGSEITD